ncbi:MAG: hypothetical protein SPE48_04440 [Treponema porcinum]|uniref:hypothetical protein n=1 Tax=Treponema porcinum TaxID=261392 RepID=UPI002A822804|nr:hypothetical protein [Treponema porcinum]MDY5121148.1 hypothetical protein [Treponema porcinum]
MAKKSGVTIGRLLLQLALGAMLAVAGIWSFQGQGHGDDAVGAIRAVFDGNVENVLVVVFGVIELLAGIFLILELFMGDQFGKLDNILMLIVMIVWIVAIILMDFLAKGGLLNGFNAKNFLEWLYTFAAHLIILGAMITLND